MKSSRVIFLICVGLDGSLFAQSPDPFQHDIPAPLVAKVDDAKEKQVDSKDLSAAEVELQDVLKQRPDYYRALFNLGLIYQAQGKADQAVETLEKAKSLRDSLHISDSSILNSIGWAYMNSGKLDKAESSFLEALKEGHANKPIETQRLLNNLGYLYVQKGDTAKARFYLQRSINEYNSSGARKVLKMADEYDQREKIPEKNFTNSLGRMMVWISSLRIWVSETEVSQSEFASLMDRNPSQNTGAGDLPVDSVTAPEAIEFCARLTKREALPSRYSYALPTDAQWSVYVDNATLQDAITSEDKARSGPAPVKSLSPNEFGLYDTRGNVWEWTRTPYSADLNSTDIRAKFKGLDPHGQVLRGGSWRSKGDLLKTTTRGSNSPTLRDSTNGFRIVFTMSQ